MFTPKCTHAGCHWTGTPKKTKVLAEQAVRMHVGRVHDRNIRLPKKPKIVPEVLMSSSAPKYASLPITDHRSKAWRMAHPVLVKPINGGGRHKIHVSTVANGVEVKVNFCANCGAPIEGLAEAVVLAGLLRSRPKFRAKVEKLLEKHT